MAKIGTAHVEIKPVIDEAELQRVCDAISQKVASAVRSGIADGATPSEGSSSTQLAEHPCDGCGRQTSLRVCNSCHGTPDDPQWCRACNGVCKGRPGCSPLRAH